MPAQRTGTGYVNLQQWLGLNQGGAAQLGNTLAQDVGKEGAAAQGTLTGSASRLSQAKQEALGNPAEGMTVAELQALRGQAYNGPTSLDLTGQQVNDIATAGKKANMLGDNTGRAQLLGDKYGANSWGGSQLDAALAGTGGGAGALGQTQGRYGQLLQRLGSAQQSASSARTSVPQEIAARNARIDTLLPGAQQRESAAAQQQSQQQQSQARQDQQAGQQERGANIRETKDRRAGRSRFDLAYPSYP